MPKPTFFRYDSTTYSFYDADGNILVTLPAPTSDLTQTIAVTFGYSAETAPDILCVGSGAPSDEDVPSQAHLDTVAAFSTEPGSRV
ncbi:hypothetical protein GobsT_35760 [Gemmata obscuriglobus]|nr:hypothetical protein [Gemmata obscuriglobus]QEG28789.1 hypothetical protein GobsT_35760 [Gemmata obscuriglobus]VTS07148.1 unnamed protein product [Gemmata obscuriglobus UQM 2246]